MNRPYPFILRDWYGRPVPAGYQLRSLVFCWNSATNPWRAMTDREHKRAGQYARAIRRRMDRLGFVLGRDYRELSNGMLWPILKAGRGIATAHDLEAELLGGEGLILR